MFCSGTIWTAMQLNVAEHKITTHSFLQLAISGLQHVALDLVSDFSADPPRSLKPAYMIQYFK